MRLTSGVVVFAAFAWTVLPVSSQTTKKPTKAIANKSVIPARNLSDAFSIAALKAMKSVASATDIPSIDGGHILIPRATKEPIDNADANAVTDNERTVVRTINDLYFLKLMMNMKEGMYTMQIVDSQDAAKQTAAAAADPELRALRTSFGACYDALDNVLRSRTFVKTPAECLSIQR